MVDGGGGQRFRCAQLVNLTRKCFQNDDRLEFRCAVIRALEEWVHRHCSITKRLVAITPDLSEIELQKNAVEIPVVSICKVPRVQQTYTKIAPLRRNERVKMSQDIANSGLHTSCGTERPALDKMSCQKYGTRSHLFSFKTATHAKNDGAMLENRWGPNTHA